MKPSSIILFAALGVSGVGCGARMVPLRDQGTMMIPTPQPEAQVRAAVARALAERHYVVELEEPHKVTARLESRGTVLRITIEYGPDHYSVQYLDSQGYNYQNGPNGRVIGRAYANNTEALRRGILDELGRPAREAQAVASAQQAQVQAAANAAAEERDRDRQAAIEVERLRTARAQADADRAQANRPVIVGHVATPVVGLAFNAQTVQRARGAVRINPGFTPDPRVLTGTAGGNVSAAQLNMPQGCEGFYAGQPSHLIVLARSFDYLRMETASPTDTTLAVVAPDGSVWCDDDGAGSHNARIAGQFPAGPYRIYVGNYAQSVTSPFQLIVSAGEAPAAAQPMAAEPVAAEPAQPEAPPDCRAALLAAGHNAVHMMHCDGAEPYCAVALLQAGHNPAHLIHCHDVDPTCAVNLLRAGRNPAELISCHQQ